jgi:hypothetical protein
MTITGETFFLEVIVCFVDIGGIDDHHCLNFLFVLGPNGNELDTVF